jgi:hypothetical protein
MISEELDVVHLDGVPYGAMYNVEFHLQILLVVNTKLDWKLMIVVDLSFASGFDVQNRVGEEPENVS